MKLRIVFIFAPMIAVLTLGCSETGPPASAEPVKTEAAKAPDKASKKRRPKEPTKQLGPEGVVD